MTRRILVLGATSLIGRRLLAAPPAGVELVALSRRPPATPLAALSSRSQRSGEPGPRTAHPTPEPLGSGSATSAGMTGGGEMRGGVRASAGADWIDADLGAPELALKLPRVDAILSLSPIWLLPAALPALLNTGARRLVAVSSTSRLTKEASPVAEERAVAARLADGEAAVMAACAAAGVGWTILRPTLIYAEGEDRNVSRLAALIARLGVLPLAGRGEGLRQPVHAQDLARAALQALDAPAAADKVYALPGGETLSYREMARRIFEALGRPPRLLSLPPPLWRLGLALASPVLPGATAAMGGRMSEDLTFDAGPAMRDFGYAPRPFRPDFRGTALSGSRARAG